MEMINLQQSRSRSICSGLFVKKRRTRRWTYAAAAIALFSGLWPLSANPAAAQAGASNISGRWQLCCTTKRGRRRDVSLQVRQNGSTLSGTYSAARGSGPLSGSVQGTQVSFGAGAFTFSGAVAGNTIKTDLVSAPRTIVGATARRHARHNRSTAPPPISVSGALSGQVIHNIPIAGNAVHFRCI
jgi:hypothetical protein